MAFTHFSGPVVSQGGFVVGTDDLGSPAILSGAGVPTMRAAKGTLYINTTGSSPSTRILINIDGATGWTPLTAGA